MNQDTLVDQFAVAMGDPAAVTRIVVSVLVAVVLGWVLAQLYHLYYRGTEPVDSSMARSFPLMAPAVTLIFILVQFSLPLSLGLLGAMSFVRFRSPVKRAEDIAFILVLIACALSCGVQYYHAALILLALVALVAVVRRMLPGVSVFSSANALVTIHHSGAVDMGAVESALGDRFGRPAVLSSRTADGVRSLVLSLRNHTSTRDGELQEALGALLGPGASVEIFHPENQSID